MIEDTERQYIRELAGQVAEIAASPENQLSRKRWHDVNALRKPDRPPVWCLPVGAWGEILPEESLTCTDPRLRNMERSFRRTLIKHEMGDDSVVEPYFSVGAAFDCDPPNVWGLEVGKVAPSTPGGAWASIPPIVTADDLDKLQMPRFTYNNQATQEGLSRAHDLLGDILPIKLVCGGPLTSATLGTDAADLRGLSQMMMDMIVEPELFHRLMAHLRDAVMESARVAEETGLFTNDVGYPMLHSEPIGPKSPDGKLTCKNLWLMLNSQEFDQVSPAMWEEFCLNYQKPIMEMFGMVSYGCCENLTKKIDGVLSIPNLRIFVCSAWTDLDKVIERVGKDYVIMWRQKASDVVFPDDPSTIKRDLEDGMRRLEGCHVQVVLRELQTLAGHPDRLHVWAKYAKEAAEKYA